ncbi:MAG: phage holin family protein [Chitinispirillales bacterium]|jgi:hypothetical protein|nr:phage holin family protein [Chitinispirillales bacterium]
MNYTDYIKPELLVLIPALYFLGEILKSSFKLDHNKIPLAFGISGIILSSIWVLAVSKIAHYQDALMAIFIALVQGLLCAGTAVYGYEILKQHKQQKDALQNVKPD